MTSIEDNIVQTRVLVDWDGDSFFNEGVLQSTPINNFPSQLYATGSFLRGFDTTGLVENYTDTVDPSERGFIKRGIRLGDQAITIRFLLDDYRDFQPHIGDITNHAPGANRRLFAEYPYSVLPVDGQTARLVATPPIYDNGLVGALVGTNRYATLLGASNTHTYSNEYETTGYWDAPKRWSKSISAGGAFTWGGFDAIVPTQTYTLVCYLYAPRKNFTVSSVTIQPRIYGDGGAAGTPNFGRQDMGGADVALNVDTWTAVREVFTVPAGATKMSLDLQVAAGMGGVEFYIGGIMLLDGNVALPDRFWDEEVGYISDQFSFVVPGDSQPYVYSYWVKSPNGITKLSPTKHVGVIGTNTVTDTALSDITVTSSWQRVNMAVAADSAERGVWLTFTAEKSGVPVDASHAGDVEFSGFMITEGSIDTYPYHAGTLYGYDDISDYVLSVNTDSGRSSFNDTLPAEGVATFQLNNADRRFSPSNPTSPLYGYLVQNRKVKVQLWNSVTSAWVDLWSGWTYQYDVVPGEINSNQATIECQQGIFRLAEGTLTVPVLANTTNDVLARTIIENSGWRSTSSVLQSFVGLHTLVGENAYVMDAPLLYDVVETGVNQIEVSGKDWANATDPRKALEDILEAENGAMWINRDGSISVVNRNHWIKSTVDDTFVLDTEVNSAEYAYGQDIVNSVDVTLTKNKALSGQTVWETKRPVAVAPRQVWVIDLNPEYTEGRAKTVIEYTLDGMTKNVYTKDTGINTVTTDAAATQAQSDAVSVELLGSAGERPRLRVTNKAAVKLWVHLAINGTYLDTGDGEIVRIEDDVAVNIVQGRHNVAFSSPVITTERQAESYGSYRILRQAYPLGEFGSFKITVRNQADLNRILLLQPGSVVVLSEVKSAEDTLTHAIIGESISIADSHTLSVTYRAARSLQEKFAKTDISVTAESTPNLIPLGSTIEPTNGGTVGKKTVVAEGISEVDYWQVGRGHGSKLVFAPSRDQLRVYRATEDIGVYPATDSAGNATGIQGAVVEAENMVNNRSIDMPTGYTRVLRMLPRTDIPATFVAAGTGQAFWGVKRSSNADASVAGIAHDCYFTALADAKYIARLEAWRPGSFLSGSITLKPLGNRADGNSGVVPAVDLVGWNVMTAAVPVINTYSTSGGGNVTTAFEARYASGVYIPTSTLGFKIVSETNQLSPGAFINLCVLRYSDYGRISGTFLDSTISHKYSVFAKLDHDSVSASYTLTVIAEDGSTIGTHAQTLTDSSVTQFEVNIPAGNTSAWAYLTRTTEGVDDAKIYIYGYGVTKAAVTSYLDLLVPNTQEKAFA